MDLRQDRRLLLAAVYNKVKSQLHESSLDDASVKIALAVVKSAIDELNDTNGNEDFRAPQPLVIFNCWQIPHNSLRPLLRTKGGYLPLDAEGGSASYVTYDFTISPTKLVCCVPNWKGSVKRRYKEFDKLREKLAKQYRYRLVDGSSICTYIVNPLLVPHLPPKQALKTSSKFDKRFVRTRCKALQCWLEYICLHRLLQLSEPVTTFLLDKQHANSVSCCSQLENRASQQLDSMRSRFTRGAVALPALKSSLNALEVNLDNALRALNSCTACQKEMDKARAVFSKSMAVLGSAPRMLKSVLCSVVSPLDAATFESLKPVCELFSKDVIPSLRKLFNHHTKKDKGEANSRDIEADRLAAEFIEVENVRQAMLVRSLEELVLGQIEQARNATKAYQQLFEDLSGNRESNPAVVQRYLCFEKAVECKSSISEALEVLCVVECEDVEIPETSSHLDNSILSSKSKPEFRRLTKSQSRSRRKSNCSQTAQETDGNVENSPANASINDNMTTNDSHHRIRSTKDRNQISSRGVGARLHKKPSVEFKEKMPREGINQLESHEHDQVKELANQIGSWKQSAKVGGSGLDLAGLLVTLPQILDLKKFKIDEFYAKKPEIGRLRSSVGETRKLYLNVIKRVHPDKMASDISLQDKMRCREVFITLADFAT